MQEVDNMDSGTKTSDAGSPSFIDKARQWSVNEEQKRKEKELEENIERLSKENNQINEVLSGVKEILEGDSVEVRMILSDLIRIRRKVHNDYLDVVPLALSFLIVCFTYVFLGFKSYITFSATTFTIAIFLAIFLFFPLHNLWKFFIKKREKALHLKLAEYHRSERLKNIETNKEKDFFKELVSINFLHIDTYYRQTQIQSNKSFSTSIICAVIAFFIIISGILLMYTGKIQTAYIATGSGLISEFIAAVFFYLYNQTIIKMGEYHQKLVLTQNVSLALKITEDIEDKEEKTKSQTFIVQQLLQDVNQYLAFSKK